jgi:signal recognition particle subunit SRP72
MEKIDIPQTYTEIDEAIIKEDHEKVLSLSEKIIKFDPKEKEAFQCKIIALLNLSRNDEIITFIEKSSLEKDYLMEYAYALHEKKRYLDSINILNQHSQNRIELSSNISELLAQNYYKLGQFKDSYTLYKEIIENKLKSSSSDLEEEKDLISNFLASYVLSSADDQNLLTGITKYLNTWESFYNYCLISLKNNNFNESLEILYRMKRDYPSEEEFSDLKNSNLQLNIIQSVVEGFEFSKVTNIIEDYDKFFTKNSHSHPELLPYFYNNFLHIKKDRESLNEVLKKLENFLKMDIFPQEKQTLLLNKIILLLRANKIPDAYEIFKTLPQDFNDKNYVIIYCYILLKQEKIEKLEEILKNDQNLKNKPESHLIVIQLILSSLTSKNIEQFHFKVLNFVKTFFEFSINPHFLNFFIGFYESRHLKDYLKEFIRNYKDPNLIVKKIGNSENNKKMLKKCLSTLGKAFYTVGLYEESASFYFNIVENVDKFDQKIRLELINSLSHYDAIRSEEIRRQSDETMIDLSAEHISNLLSEVFFKSRKNVGNAPEGEKKKNKKKKKRFPKNYDPKKPGPMPDAERWLPKLQRKKYRNVAKNKMAYQGASADHTTTSSQFRK